MAEFNFKTATPITTGVDANAFWFGAASQAAATPSIYSMGALTSFLSTATLAAGTITTSQPHTLTQTWNAGGTTFTAVKVNVTDTASDSASLLMDLQVGGTTVFNISKTGTFYSPSTFSVFTGGSPTRQFVVGETAIHVSPNSGSAILTLCNDTPLTFQPDGSGNSRDLYLYRDAAGILAQRNGTNAQTLRVYGTFTDASNYERVSLSHTTGTGSILATETAGTGADNLSLRLTAAGTGGIASAFAVTALDGTAIPAGGTAGSGYKFSSTSNFGVFFGSGAPSLSAAKGSLYLRSDGSGVADRAYINTNGSTTWTAIATAG